MRSVDFLSGLLVLGVLCSVPILAQDSGESKPAENKEKISKDKPADKVKPEKKKDENPTPKPPEDTEPKPNKDSKPKDDNPTKVNENGKNKQVDSALPNDALGRYIVERFNQLGGSIEDLRAANALQARKIDALITENEKLRAMIVQIGAQSKRNFATQEEFRGAQKRIEEIDKKRIGDREKILAEFTKLLRKIAKINVVAQNPPKPTPKPAPQKSIKTVEHTVATGEFLSGILALYNEHFRKEKKGRISMGEILKANPGMNPEKIFVGSKIYIPLPGQIK